VFDPPDIAYLVCATPRSGSTLLCEMLTDTGVAGRPGEPFELLRGSNRPRQPREYFEAVDDPAVLDLLPPLLPPAPAGGPFDERLRTVIREGTTPNGVFGAKLMWGYQADLQARLAELPDLERRSPAARLAAVFGDVRYIHVWRDDNVAQAVSLWRAVQTSAWRAEDDNGHEPRYSHAGIDHFVRMLEAHRRAWAEWFDAEGITPLELRYEDVDADPSEAVRRTLEHIGIEPAGALPEPALQRQSGPASHEWAERYRRECG